MLSDTGTRIELERNKTNYNYNHCSAALTWFLLAGFLGQVHKAPFLFYLQFCCKKAREITYEWPRKETFGNSFPINMLFVESGWHNNSDEHSRLFTHNTHTRTNPSFFKHFQLIYRTVETGFLIQTLKINLPKMCSPRILFFTLTVDSEMVFHSNALKLNNTIGYLTMANWVADVGTKAIEKWKFNSLIKQNKWLNIRCEMFCCCALLVLSRY